ncbi:Uu.00g036950.m01.CDS01 [Anthostomella pinea]|uniref:Uu.00g036950.m01.CDS01 n=1 Tax=Anthostomella pinea TaxID=933095 RepID=A0AAI8VA18_9PEZI|nr:Uu.00g036950.m01.CDS01 [Anthostomella pinea]
MKTVAVASSLLLTVAAVPVEQRQATEMDFTNFVANTIANGNGAVISYDIAIPGVMSTHCAYFDSTSTEELPSVSAATCDNSAMIWQFHQDPSLPGAEGQYRIVVTYIDASGVGHSGYHEWLPTDFPAETYGSTSETVYRGESSFVISDLS